MALEAVVYPQDPFGYSRDQYYALAGGLPELADEKSFLDAFNDDPTANNPCCWDYYSSSSANTSAMHGVSISSGQWPALDPNSSSPETTCAAAAVAATATEVGSGGSGQPSPSAVAAGGGGGGGGGRRKRRRSRSSKNKEEIENQRMTHIAVERNRRKQMNEYLAVLRSLMPPSYSQRGDQASIIGGAINFVKELEQLLQSMQTHKSKPKPLQDLAAAAAAAANNNDNSNNDVASPFAEFFSFPQYSTRLASAPCGGPTEPATALEDRSGIPHPQWAVADIEVTMVESHANMKIFSKKRPRQLLQLVAGLQGLRLTVLHLNVTTVDDSVLYSVSVKVEEGCHLNTVDEIAAAVHELLRRIEEGAGAFT